jgi:hypothetical protein
LIASSTSIVFKVPGSIIASGGAGGCTPCGGGGSGGAVRLIAPALTAQNYCGFACPAGTTGGIFTAGGSPNGTQGRIRLESFNPGNFGVTYLSGVTIVSTPVSLAIPQTAPGSIKVTSLLTASGIIPINANPFSFPDAVINQSSPLTVNVQAQFVPLGAIPKIILMSETGNDQTVSCSPLAGTVQTSTCSASIVLPAGGSRGFVQVKW